MDTHRRPIFFSLSFPYVKGDFYENVFEVVVTFPLSVLFLLLSLVSSVCLGGIYLQGAIRGISTALRPDYGYQEFSGTGPTSPSQIFLFS